jgi:heme-degrading monooxygenase HmoA
MATFIAMNHFQVNPERGDEFEEHWRKRESYLHEVPGFRHFALLRGDEPGSYVSHSTWRAATPSKAGLAPRPSARPTPRRARPRAS